MMTKKHPANRYERLVIKQKKNAKRQSHSKTETKNDLPEETDDNLGGSSERLNSFYTIRNAPNEGVS